MPAGPFPKRAETPNARDTATEKDINEDCKQLSSQVLCLGWNQYSMTLLVGNSLLTGKHWGLQLIDLSCDIYIDVVDCSERKFNQMWFHPSWDELFSATFHFAGNCLRLPLGEGDRSAEDSNNNKKVSLKPLNSHDQNCFRPGSGEDDFFQLEGSFNFGQLWLPVFQVPFLLELGF